MNEALSAETISIAGHGGDEIEAYLARPTGSEQFGSVVVIHHMPGYDSETTMRAQFTTRLGTSPRAYRQTFGRRAG